LKWSRRQSKRGKVGKTVKMLRFFHVFRGFQSSRKRRRCLPSPGNSNLTCASAAAPEARNARFKVLGVRLEAGVGSGEVLEVAFELCCRCGRGRSLGASSVDLGLELAAAGLHVRRGCSAC